MAAARGRLAAHREAPAGVAIVDRGIPERFPRGINLAVELPVLRFQLTVEAGGSGCQSCMETTLSEMQTRSGEPLVGIVLTVHLAVGAVVAAGDDGADGL